jgi:DNA-binding YbaB/EbfC family protein
VTVPGDELVPFDEADDPDELFDLDDDLDDGGDAFAGLLGGGGLGGLGDLGGLLGAAQQAMARAEQAAQEVVEGSSAGGAVRVQVNGAFEFSKLTIRPDAIDPDDVELLEDMILAALNDASSKIRDRQQRIQQDMMGGLGGLGGLGDLLGGT